jgi:hypothetical protein
VKRLREDVDKRSRLGWYKMTTGQKILLLEPHVAEAIYNDFVAHKDRKEYGKLVKQLMTSSSRTIFPLMVADSSRIQCHI